MKTEFKDLLKKIKSVKYRTDKDWEIFLPHNTHREKIQFIIDACKIDACKDEQLVKWHIIYPEPTDQLPEPEIRIYWDIT